MAKRSNKVATISEFKKANVQKQIEEYSNVVRLPNKGTNQVKTSAEDMKNKAGYKD